jgi:transposase
VAANGWPIAREAMARMQPLFAIEREIERQLPDARLAVLQARAAPIMVDLHAWLQATPLHHTYRRTALNVRQRPYLYA